MKITPLEIRQKEFEKVLRGYEKDEVKAFLGYLSQEWEKLLADFKDIKARLDISEKEVSRLRDLENSLYKTLKTAEDTGANLIEQTKKETELQLKASKIQSEELINEARMKAREIIESAENKSANVLEDMMEKMKKLEANYNQIFDLREKYIARFRSLINENNERLDKITSDLSEKETREIVREARNIYNSSSVERITGKKGSESATPTVDTEKPDTVRQNMIPPVNEKSFFDEIE